MKLAVSETFYSIQGEGLTTGYPAVFLRLGGCNLMCGGWGTQKDNELHDGATWRCDSIEVWMKSKGKEFDNIFDNECMIALQCGAHLVITGGEPLMQQDKLMYFIKWLRNGIPELYIEIETNGTIVPTNSMLNLVNQWNCSPKLSNSGMGYEARYNAEAIRVLNQYNTIFKFVISTEDDWDEILQEYYKAIDKSKIMLMPSGSNQKELKKTKTLVADICKNNFIKFSNRLHIDIWNKKTGV
jgi:7-carboxy-7-deazaguanine synthase